MLTALCSVPFGERETSASLDEVFPSEARPIPRLWPVDWWSESVELERGLWLFSAPSFLRRDCRSGRLTLSRIQNSRCPRRYVPDCGPSSCPGVPAIGSRNPFPPRSIDICSLPGRLADHPLD